MDARKRALGAAPNVSRGQDGRTTVSATKPYGSEARVYHLGSSLDNVPARSVPSFSSPDNDASARKITARNPFSLVAAADDDEDSYVVPYDKETVDYLHRVVGPVQLAEIGPTHHLNGTVFHDLPLEFLKKLETLAFFQRRGNPVFLKLIREKSPNEFDLPDLKAIAQGSAVFSVGGSSCIEEKKGAVYGKAISRPVGQWRKVCQEAIDDPTACRKMKDLAEQVLELIANWPPDKYFCLWYIGETGRDLIVRMNDRYPEQFHRLSSDGRDMIWCKLFVGFGKNELHFFESFGMFLMAKASNSLMLAGDGSAANLVHGGRRPIGADYTGADLNKELARLGSRRRSFRDVPADTCEAASAQFRDYAVRVRHDVIRVRNAKQNARLPNSHIPTVLDLLIHSGLTVGLDNLQRATENRAEVTAFLDAVMDDIDSLAEAEAMVKEVAPAAWKSSEHLVVTLRDHLKVVRKCMENTANVHVFDNDEMMVLVSSTKHNDTYKYLSERATELAELDEDTPRSEWGWIQKALLKEANLDLSRYTEGSLAIQLKQGNQDETKTKRRKKVPSPIQCNPDPIPFDDGKSVAENIDDLFDEDDP